MKRALLVILVCICSLSLASVASAAESGKLNLKVGDQVYVCGCGKGCPCETMSMKEAKCTCGQPLVKGVVTKVEADKATVKTDKEERAFKTVGKYACACGAGCDCNTISQNPGKCACGKEMKKVEAKI